MYGIIVQCLETNGFICIHAESCEKYRNKAIKRSEQIYNFLQRTQIIRFGDNVLFNFVSIIFIMLLIIYVLINYLKTIENNSSTYA